VETGAEQVNVAGVAERAQRRTEHRNARRGVNASALALPEAPMVAVSIEGLECCAAVQKEVADSDHVPFTFEGEE
jgi:hypothetical protein